MHLSLRYTGLLLIAGLYASCLSAQSSAGEGATLETRFIVDLPTAGVLPKLHHAISTHIFPEGGLMIEWSLAPFQDFNVGIAFGGTGLIGNGAIEWQKAPGLHARYRILNETQSLPALLLGFSSQGRGKYDSDSERFATQSPGIYAALSKSFEMLGRLDLHAGVNYSFEPSPDDRTANLYLGLNKSIGAIFSLAAEYNATFFDNYREMLDHRGLLNASARCALGKGFTLEFQVRDILSHFRDASNPTRTLTIEYSGSF